MVSEMSVPERLNFSTPVLEASREHGSGVSLVKLGSSNVISFQTGS